FRFSVPLPDSLPCVIAPSVEKEPDTEAPDPKDSSFVEGTKRRVETNLVIDVAEDHAGNKRQHRHKRRQLEHQNGEHQERHRSARGWDFVLVVSQGRGRRRFGNTFRIRYQPISAVVITAFSHWPSWKKSRYRSWPTCTLKTFRLPAAWVMRTPVTGQ